MLFTRSHILILFTYCLSEIPIERVLLHKDLGISYSPALRFEHYINITIRKFLKILGFIKRISRMYTSPSFLRSLYSALVHLTLEYEVVVWHPYLVNDQYKNRSGSEQVYFV